MVVLLALRLESQNPHPSRGDLGVLRDGAGLPRLEWGTRFGFGRNDIVWGYTRGFWDEAVGAISEP
jgi:hypothetical protein